MAKELKKRRDEAKQAWENATVVMKTAKKVSDFTGVRKAHGPWMTGDYLAEIPSE
jgi:hypothetical protein